MSQTPFCRLPRFTLSRTRQLAGWQVCSLLLTATGFTSQRLADRGIDAPTAQSLATYVCLLLHGLRRPPLSAADAARISRPWWQWLLLAFADVEGNYLIVRAYQYTDITSVTLLDAFAVPVVMVISSIALHARYSRWQLVGVVVCLVGLIVLVTTDTLLQPMHQWQPHPWLGDILALVGACLYACANVAEESWLRDTSNQEYLPRLGAYGALVSTVQCAVLERQALVKAYNAFAASSNPGRRELILLEVGFVGAMAAFYTLVSALLQAGATAAEMNISLLTADFWSVLVGVALLGSRLSMWYPAAFTATMTGLVLFYSSATVVRRGQLTEPLNRADYECEDATTCCEAPTRTVTRLNDVGEVRVDGEGS